MFQGDRRGIVNFTNCSVKFIDNASVPFGTVVKIPLEYKTGLVPPHKEKRNRIIFGAPGTGKATHLTRIEKTFQLRMKILNV